MGERTVAVGSICEAIGWLKCYVHKSVLSIEEEATFKNIIDLLVGVKTKEEMVEEERIKEVSRRVAGPDNQI